MTNIFTAIVSAFLGISQIMPSGVPSFSADWNSLSMNCGWGSLVKTFIKAAPKKGRIIANPRIKGTGRTSTHFTGNHRSNAGSRPAVSSNTGENIKTPNANIGMKYGDKTVKRGSVYVNDKKVGKYGGDISNKMINSSCAGSRCGGTYYKEQLVQDKNGTFYKGVAPV
ncbi:MAG: hypothetical protein J5706_05075, partial [Elusimicrobiales bacterium]|nr:hypothetical protein [Elusimicrobiales bacterium]